MNRTPLVRRVLATLIGATLLAGGVTVVVPAEPADAAGSGLRLTTPSTAVTGSVVSVAYETDAPAGDNWVGIFAAGETPGASGVRSATYQNAAGTSGSLDFSVDTSLPTGSYRIHFLARGGYTALAPAVSLAVADHVLTLSSTKLRQGSTLSVSYETSTPHPANWIGIYDAATTPAPGVPRGGWAYARGQSGTVEFDLDAATFAAGQWYVYLFSNDSYERLLPRGRQLTVTNSSIVVTAVPSGDVASTAAVADALAVRWDTSVPHAKNWVGIYPAGTTPGEVTGQKWWYTGVARSDHLNLDITESWDPGRYDVYLFARDGYTVLDRTRFSVRETFEPLVPSFEAQGGRVGEAYELTVGGLFLSNVANAARPTIAATSIPAGLTLVGSGAEATLRGTPTVAGTYTVTVRASAPGRMTQTTSIGITIAATGAAVDDRLSVMTYNAARYKSPLSQMRAFLSRSADVVMVQEDSVAAMAEIRERLGWSSAGSGRAVFSRYPIVEERALEGATGTGSPRDLKPATAARIQVDPASGRTLWAVSVHLFPRPYGPDALASDNPTVDDLLAAEQESVRAEDMQAIADELVGMREDPALSGDDFVVSGDFNTPSHLDWTQATSDRHRGLVVEWPASVSMADADFADAYREVHPDPVADPGYTWLPTPSDRIDRTYLWGESLEVVSSQTIGALPLGTWVSDHQGVSTLFAWR